MQDAGQMRRGLRWEGDGQACSSLPTAGWERGPEPENRPRSEPRKDHTSWGQGVGEEGERDRQRQGDRQRPIDTGRKRETDRLGGRHGDRERQTERER